MKRLIIILSSVAVAIVLIALVGTYFYVNDTQATCISAFSDPYDLWKNAFNNTATLDEYTLNYSLSEKTVYDGAKSEIKSVTENSSVKLVVDFGKLKLHYKLTQKITQKDLNGKATTQRIVKETYVEAKAATLVIYQRYKDNETALPWKKTEIFCGSLAEMRKVFSLYCRGAHPLSNNEYKTGEVSAALTGLIYFKFDGEYIKDGAPHIYPLNYLMTSNTQKATLVFKDNKISRLKSNSQFTEGGANVTRNEKWTVAPKARVNVPLSAKQAKD